MTKDEALKWIVETKAISPFTRNFIIWLYDEHGGFIANKGDTDKINGMTILAHIHGVNPFEEKGENRE